ncbi:MAG: mrdA [Burkholderiales bacterium]|jgi:penicillin-binding protein 2|nr:mrdA [Burkholderiales bacterium]
MSKSRIIAAYIFVFFSFILLFTRYAYLQLFNHNVFLQQSIDNYSSIVPSQPIRGTIVDRNSVILADNQAAYALAVLPKDVKRFQNIFSKISKYANITELDKKKYKVQLQKAKNYDWIVIKDDLSNVEIANLTAHNYEFPELLVFAHIKRIYPFDELYSHSIGYVGRVSLQDKNKLIKSGRVRDYTANDYIGKSGLEQYYEKTLRGQLGRKTIQTDATGNEVRLLNNTAAVDGYTLKLTVDNALQKLAWNLLGERKGAVVAINPQTGGILAFVSKPGFDPNWFIDGISLDDWSDLSQNPGNPLLNRAAQGTYPPGSTFKPFLALASLYLGFRTPNYTMNDPGYFVIPGSSRHYRDSYPYGLGMINMKTALIKSSDAYFYKLGLDMGVDRIHKGLSIFGLGSKTGIDLPIENTGLLPSREWKAKRFANDEYQKNWLPADSVSVGIGQGFNNYTPLQMAHAVSIIANGGINIKPHFLDQVIDENGKVIESYTVSSTKLPIKAADINFIREAMHQVILQGTARGISSGLKYDMAGKTGTAQVVGLSANSRQAKFSGSQFKDHSWFIAFAPMEKPTIAAAIIVENGGWGAGAAAPIARSLFDFYLLGPENPAQTDGQYKKFTPTASVKVDTDDDDSGDDDSGGSDDSSDAQ